MRNESCAADRVKNQIHTRTAGQLPRTFGHVLGPRIDRAIGAQRTHEGRLFIRVNQADHSLSGNLSELDNGAPDPPAAPVASTDS